MKNFSASTKHIEDPRPYLKDPGQKRTLLGWWYRIASPPEPQSLASFEQRERFRRGRTGSQVVLAILAIYLAGLPDAFTGTNRFLVVILSVAMLAMAVAILLNRRGHVALAGIIVVIAVTASPLTDLVTAPGGLNSSRIPVFCMLVLPLMCTVSFLPAWWVFVAAVGNCLFALFVMTLVPHAAELNAMLKVSFVGVVTPIILSQIIVAVVAYLWVTGAVQAIRRADRAEEIAELERDLALRAENSAQQKEHLNQVIEEKNVALQQANAHLATLATTDPLTELPNHRALFETLEKEVERARRYGHPLSILFFDGDHFKRVNDTYGHSVGDAVLRELGSRAKGVLRGGDTLGRYGGEEFMVLLPETDLVLAREVAERLRVAIAAHPLEAGLVEGGLHVTISIGVATFPVDGQSASEVVEQADQAMYWAKRLGRNQLRTVLEAQQAAADNALTPTLSTLERRDEEGGQPIEQVVRDHQLSTIHSLMWLLELRDRGISTHSYQVSDLAGAMAQELGLEQAEVFAISTAGLLHDIGKVAIPDYLLQKEGPLSASERALVQQHPELGAQILEVSPYLHTLMPAVCHHHENWDGTGYPQALRGEEIPLAARIIRVSEAYQAMMSNRPYQARRSAEAARHELQRCSGTQFDTAVVEAAIRVLLRQEEEALEGRDVGLVS